MKLTPIGERVLLKPLKQEEKTAGGIYLPESNDKKKQGEVIAIGKTKEETDLKPGDKIIYGGYSSEEIEVDGQEYIIVDLKDVMAKIE